MATWVTLLIKCSVSAVPVGRQPVPDSPPWLWKGAVYSGGSHWRPNPRVSHAWGGAAVWFPRQAASPWNFLFSVTIGYAHPIRSWVAWATLYVHSQIKCPKLICNLFLQWPSTHPPRPLLPFHPNFRYSWIVFGFLPFGLPSHTQFFLPSQPLTLCLCYLPEAWLQVI